MTSERYFADGNNEWPVVARLKLENAVLEAMGKFKADTLPIANACQKRYYSTKIFDRAGYR